MAVVLVVDFDVGVRRFALPVADQLERTRAGALLDANLILEDVDVKVGGGWVLLVLATQQRGERGHVEVQHGTVVGGLGGIAAEQQLRPSRTRFPANY